MFKTVGAHNVIMFDEDGTCVDTQQVVIGTMNREFNTNYTVADASSYDWFVKTVMSLDKEYKTPEDARKFLFNENVIRKALPTLGIQRLVTELHHLGFQIVKATARSETQREVTLESNEMYFPEVSQIFMRQPQHNKFDAKLHAIQTKRPLVFIDDDADLLYNLQRFVSEETFFILIDRPWNQVVRSTGGKKVFVTRDDERLRRFGFFKEDNHEWGKVYAWITKLSAQQAQQAK